MIRWDAPIKQNQRGCHAWQKWTYKLSIKTHLTGIFPREEPFEITIKNISTTSFLYTRIFKNLESKSDLFEFTVKAASSSGEVVILDFKIFLIAFSYMEFRKRFFQYRFFNGKTYPFHTCFRVRTRLQLFLQT